MQHSASAVARLHDLTDHHDWYLPVAQESALLLLQSDWPVAQTTVRMSDGAGASTSSGTRGAGSAR